MTPEKLSGINKKNLGLSDALSKQDENNIPTGGSSSGNPGTLMLDATCAPSNIKYLQDIYLLKDTRPQSDQLINEFRATRLKSRELIVRKLVKIT